MRTPTRPRPPTLTGSALPLPTLLLRALLLLVHKVLELLRSLIDLARMAKLLAGQVGKLVDAFLNLIAVLAEQ